MMLEVIDRSLNLEDCFEDGDWGVRFSQIVLRACDAEGRDDDVTLRRWPGVSAELVVLRGNRTSPLPEPYLIAIKGRKRAQQMVELAVANTNRQLQLIRHGTYAQVVAPPALAGSEIFAVTKLLTRGSAPASSALLLCTERAVFSATDGHIADLLAMAVDNRLSAVLRGAWDSGRFRELTGGDWYEYCMDDYDLNLLGAEFLALGKLPF